MPALATAIAPRFSPLPDADREARSVASRFRYSQLLSGTEVTLQRISHGLSGRTVFHFAGHAISGPKQNGLVLASPPGPVGATDEPILLSAGDLDRRLLRSLQLVVLSACATAETEQGFSEPDNLVRSFLRTGVPHVVASRWPVDSYLTAENEWLSFTRTFLTDCPQPTPFTEPSIRCVSAPILHILTTGPLSVPMAGEEVAGFAIPLYFLW